MTENETPEKPKNSPVMSDLKAYAPVILIALITIGAIVTVVGIITSYFNANDEAPDVLASLRPVGNLTTVKVEASKVAIEVDIDMGLCDPSAEYLVNAVVEAGVDLTLMTGDDIVLNETTNVYQIKLPRPQLTRCEFTTQRYDDGHSFTCDFNFEDADHIASFVTSRDIVEDVMDAGIISRAERETTILMEGIVKSLTGRAVTVEYIPLSEDVLPPVSCVPEAPIGWLQRSDGTWIPE